MIDFIDGEIVSIDSDAVVVKCGGIGYKVFCPNPYVLGDVGSELRIFTYQYVREDVIALYGFKQREERELFRQLLDVSGIGPKGALAILASGEPQEVVQAIYDENVHFLTRLPGIGKKTAQRIILDLKDKLEIDVWLHDVISGSSQLPQHPVATEESGTSGEAIEALVVLGYNEKEARRAVLAVQSQAKNDNLPVDQLIRQALRTFLS